MIVCLSASYKRAKPPLLESLVLKNDEAIMRKLCSGGVLDECVLLQTCNRVEIYGHMKGFSEDSVERILKLWSAETGVSFDIITKNVTFMRGREALANLFNVASGLDSMAIGENQILGQVKVAYQKAKRLGCVRLFLDKSFMSAINSARKVRKETQISQGSLSISSAAVDFAARELGDLKHKKVLIVGAGEAGSIAAATLKRRGAKSIIIANRTYERGVRLARKVNGKAIRFNKIYKVIPQTDAVIVALTVGRPVVKASSLRETCSERLAQRRLLIIDISQPCAVEKEVGSIHGVIVRNIDDLKETVDESVRNRQAETEKANKIISEQLDHFERQQLKFLIQPLISEIYRRAESVRQHELKRALSKMAERDERRIGILDRFSRELVERILQVPIDKLRQAASNSDENLLSSAKELFRIE
jgi:glutamyl-tRNA reductase